LTNKNNQLFCHYLLRMEWRRSRNGIRRRYNVINNVVKLYRYSSFVCSNWRTQRSKRIAKKKLRWEVKMNERASLNQETTN